MVISVNEICKITNLTKAASFTNDCTFSSSGDLGSEFVTTINNHTLTIPASEATNQNLIGAGNIIITDLDETLNANFSQISESNGSNTRKIDFDTNNTAEELEEIFEKSAKQRLGGSMVYVTKSKVNWDLDEK